MWKVGIVIFVIVILFGSIYWWFRREHDDTALNGAESEENRFADPRIAIFQAMDNDGRFCSSEDAERIFKQIMSLVSGDSSEEKEGEGFTDGPFFEEQQHVLQAILENPRAGEDAEVPTNDEATAFLEYNPQPDDDTNRINALLSDKPITVGISNTMTEIEQKIAACQAMASPEGMAQANCGYCTDSNQFMYYHPRDPSTPYMAQCSSRFVADEAEATRIIHERECENIRSCANIGDRPCVWCTKNNKAMYSRDGKTPAYQTCEGDVVADSEECAKYYPDGPCEGPNKGTGPHSQECLQSMWVDAGCSMDGANAPGKNEGQTNWWNQRGAEAVRRDMQLYNRLQYQGSAESRARYLQACSGKKPDVCELSPSPFGPHAKECLRRIFLQAGCTNKGAGYEIENINARATQKSWEQYFQTLRRLTQHTNPRIQQYGLEQCIDAKFNAGSLVSYDCNPQGVELYYYRMEHGNPFHYFLFKTTATGINYNQQFPNFEGFRMDRVGIRAITFLKILQDGEYAFRVVSDDGVRVYMQEQPVALIHESSGRNVGANGGWRPQGPTAYTWTRNMKIRDRNVLFIEWYENGGGATLRLQWKPPGQATWSEIPEEVFRLQEHADVKPVYQFELGYSLKPFNVKFNAVYDTNRSWIQYKTVEGVPCLEFDGRRSWVSYSPINLANVRTFVGYARYEEFNHWSRIMDFGERTRIRRNGRWQHVGFNCLLIANVGRTNEFGFHVHHLNRGSIVHHVPNFWERNQWVHFAIVVKEDGRTTEVYKNGVLVSTKNNGSGYKYVLKQAYNNNPASRHNYIGASNWEWDGRFKGQISYLHMYDRMLTGVDIARDYERIRNAATFGANCKNQVQYCNMSEAERQECRVFAMEHPEGIFNTSQNANMYSSRVMGTSTERFYQNMDQQCLEREMATSGSNLR